MISAHDRKPVLQVRCALGAVQLQPQHPRRISINSALLRTLPVLLDMLSIAVSR